MIADSVFVTGMGVICCCGYDVNSAFNAIVDGQDGVKPLHLFDSRLKNIPLCGQVEIIPEKYSGTYRTLSLALAATDEAIRYFPKNHNLRLGVIVATTAGGLPQTERSYERLRNDPSIISSIVNEFSIHEPTAITAAICNYIGGTGLHTISTACSTSLHAVGIAKRFINRNRYDACLVVGVDALSLLTIRGFASLTLLDPTGCRPFDKNRAGISIGEGAAAMMIVSEKVASSFQLKKDARVSGWGASADCFHMTAPHPHGEGAKSAVEAALREASMNPQDISFIATHGTGTPDNDKAEICAMKSIFTTLPPFCSMKRTLGHTLAASGILESVFAIKALQQGVIPSTAGFNDADEQIGAVPSEKKRCTLNTVLKNSFGFGGNNASVIFSKCDE
ncbi:MAG: beta-ketoacyl-[acyl-carrier-protein] synthase family protein [Fibrobacter sp.]|nr:beta-ketoacyl-[acyl-carrier-protein] synthase family protein [Fibrobacter sp.]